MNFTDGTEETSSVSGKADVVTIFQERPNYVGDAFYFSAGAVDLWLGVQAVVMNLLVISFYLKSYKKVVPCMYLMMAMCDTATGFSALLLSAMFFIAASMPRPHAAVYLAYVAYPLYCVTFKVSVFLNLSIAIVRTINISWPFYRMGVMVLVVSTCVYTLGWMVFTSWQISRFHYDFSLIEDYIFEPGQHQALFTIDATRETECLRTILFLALPFILPSLVVIVCMVLQIKAILRTQPDRTANTVTQRKITITIFLLTALFFVCNTLYLCWPIVHCSKLLSTEISDFSKEHRLLMMKYMTGVMCPLLNAAFNPVILIVRGEALISFLKRKLTSVSNNTRLSVLSYRNPTFSSKAAESNVPLDKADVTTEL